MIPHAFLLWNRLRFSGALVLLLATLAARGSPAAENYPRMKLPDMTGKGRNIQRTMRLLAESTPQKSNNVRILFYGQSITEQGWTQLVTEDLKARFPHATLVVENRALAGYASQLLSRTVETDVVPFQPDLLIFHVYGAHDKYEDILRMVRERTTAEILQQNDHVTKPEHLTEEMNPAKVPIQSGNWDSFMNHNWLPSLSKKYGTEFCDQRAIWKEYLTDNRLEPKALLRDNVHLNAHGEYLMAECVKAYLRYDPKLGPSPAEGWVVPGQPVRRGSSLKMDFEGTAVEVPIKGASKLTAEMLRIDGQPVSETPSLKGFTRAQTWPGGKWKGPVKWPAIAPIQSQAPLLLEDWTMEVKRADAELDLKKMKFTFTLSGSKTGPDGSGRSDQRFVSNSGRVVIEPESWGIPYALMLANVKPVPETLTIKWTAEPRYLEKVGLQMISDVHGPSWVWLVQGLPNQKHTLEVTQEAGSIGELRVHRPPLTPAK
jgi:hypothetical protein